MEKTDHTSRSVELWGMERWIGKNVKGSYSEYLNYCLNICLTDWGERRKRVRVPCAQADIRARVRCEAASRYQGDVRCCVCTKRELSATECIATWSNWHERIGAAQRETGRYVALLLTFWSDRMPYTPALKLIGSRDHVTLDTQKRTNVRRHTTDVLSNFRRGQQLSTSFHQLKILIHGVQLWSLRSLQSVSCSRNSLLFFLWNPEVHYRVLKGPLLDTSIQFAILLHASLNSKVIQYLSLVTS
jgi:hypothetical protein